MSTTIKIKCIDQTLTYEGTPTVASGGVNEDYVEFEFCPLWDGFSKVAVFYQNKGEIYYSIVSTDNIAVIPKEVIATKGTMYLGVMGVKDNVTKTSLVLPYRIESGALDGFTPEEPTIDIYQQILAELQAIRDLSSDTLSKEQAFEKAITKQQNDYETNITNQWATYKTNLTKQQDDYETSMNTAWGKYKTDLTKQQNDYETDLSNQWTTYKNDLTNQQTTFEANTTEKLNTYESNVESIAEESATNAINKASQDKTIALSTSWDYDETNDYYTQDVLVVGIKATDKPVIDVVTDGNATNITAIRKEWAKVIQADTYDGGIKFYAKSATTMNLTVVIKPELSKVTVNNVSVDDNLNAIIPKNAGSRNAIYRGKLLGNSVTDEQYASIKNGTFDGLFIGDYWTIGGVNYRVAGFDYYLNCGDTAATTVHHVVIVPDTVLYSAKMNTSNTVEGGYVGSSMHTTGLEQAKATIKNAFNGHVLKHRIYLTNAVANGRASAGAWYDSEVDLMCEQMVYGSVIFSSVSNGSDVPANYKVEKSQLPLFQHEQSRIRSEVAWWLRDIIATYHFAFVNSNGNASYNDASGPLGVRPSFCIYGG